MINRINIHVLLVFTFLLGCVSGLTGGRDGQSVERWDNLQSSDFSSHINNKHYGRVVFARATDDVGVAINIFVNREYATSLLSGGATAVQVCQGNNKLLARYTDIGGRYVDKYRDGQIYAIPEKSVVYFLVKSKAQEQPYFHRISAEAFQALGVAQQQHTLSRVDQQKNCGKRPEILQKITLHAGALFHYNQSGYDNMLPVGKQEIINIATAIKEKQISIERIDILGFTDPQGNSAYNAKLSQQRANSVRKILVDAGIPSSIIFTEGRGESDLVVTNCLLKHRSNQSAREQCNQPNRRVEILIYKKSK